jgi:Flp pilus assembly pilin Flp
MANWSSLVGAWVRFRDSDLGASLVEYALLVVVIALVAIAGMVLLGNALNLQFADVANEVTGAPGGG